NVPANVGWSGERMVRPDAQRFNSWSDLRERFVERFALRRRCSKDPTEVSKIVRRANESLPDFKERWTEEMGYIQRQVTEMMKRVDDFIKKPLRAPNYLKGNSRRKGLGRHTRGSDLHVQYMVEVHPEARGTMLTTEGITICPTYPQDRRDGGMKIGGLNTEGKK
ncbi:hypothetical protein Tco_1190966, partial [Tanacetum coccineum]